MSVEVKVPPVGESITEVIIGEWLVAEGEWVSEGAPLVVLETDKVNMEVPAPVSGRLTQRTRASGEVANVGDLIGYMEEEARDPAEGVLPAAPASAPQAESTPDPARAPVLHVMPAAQRALATHGLDADAITPTGPGGRLLKEDVEREAARRASAVPPLDARAEPPGAVAVGVPVPVTGDGNGPVQGARQEEAVAMSPLRKTVARRLVEAQQSAALLTTFNEVDMTEVMSLRSRHQEAFTKRHGIKLGFMSFFVRAVVEGLQRFPSLNARIEGDRIVYHHYQDIGVAIGGGRGLVVPVIRNAERLGYAEIEKVIADFGSRARDNKIRLDELQGGTFSITNGGIYGSLLSTPIVNPPQSGILGMHGIQDRPIAHNGAVVIRPMMYIALTYDHRLVDGREAVGFLKSVKELVEEPSRILLEV